MALYLGNEKLFKFLQTKSEMVTTRSREQREHDNPDPNLQTGQPGTFIDLNGWIASLKDHMKCMSKEMETLQKQNEDLIS